MRKNNLAFIVFLCVLMGFVFSGCQQNDRPLTGGISISIDDAISRMIEPNISLNVEKYTITGTGPSDSSFSVDLSKEFTSYTRSYVVPGTWMIKVVASNSQGKAIGGGEAVVLVTPGDKANVSLSVKEYKGTGKLTVKLSAKYESYDVVISKVIDGVLCEYERKTMEGGDNGLTASFTLDNGFYSLDIQCSNESIKLPAPVAFRIVKDDSISASFTVDESSNILVSIDNGIIETPYFAIALDKEISAIEESVVANAEAATGNYKYIWYVDGILQEGDYSSITTSFSEVGIHEISCIAVDLNTGVIVSAKNFVSVTE